MVNNYYLILNFISGLALGLLFYGGLWLTIRLCLKKSNAGIWIFASMIARTIIVIAGFYFLSNGNIYKVATIFLGFLTTRLIVNFFIQRSVKFTNPGVENAPNTR
jgi:F1F0 ATPase subunit 2